MVWIVIFNVMGLILSLKKLLIELSKLKNKKNNTEPSAPLPENRINLTTMRKFFHFLIVIVYISGIMHDKSLLFLCSYGMLILLLLIEVG